MLDTIAGGSYGECTYAEIVEKPEKTSHNNKAWSSRKLDNGRNTIVVEATNNSTTGEIQEEISQIRTELGLVIKNVSGGAEKVNAVNYFDKPPLPLDEYYYKKRHICIL